QGGDFEMWFWLVGAPSFITDIQAAPSATLNVGDTATITLTLSAPAPPNSAVALLINNANVAVSATPRVTSPPNAPSAFGAEVQVSGRPTATFTATGRVAGRTIIKAQFGGQTVALTLEVIPLPDLTGALNLRPSVIFVDASATATFNLTGPAPSKGLVVTLRSSDPGVAQLPATVTVPGGSTTGTFNVDGNSVGTATITAQAGNVTLSAILTVRARKTIGKPESKEGVGKERIGKEAGGIEKRAGREINPLIRGTFNKVTETIQPNPAGSVPPKLEARVSPAAAGQAFIRADERPPAGEAVLNAPAPPEAKPEAARAGDGSPSASARSKGKRSVSGAGQKRKSKSIEKPVVAEKGAIAEGLGKRPV